METLIDTSCMSTEIENFWLENMEISDGDYF